MTNKSNILKTFNTQFFAFLDDVIKVLPDNEGILIGKKSFETIKRANPTIIIKVWYSYIYSQYKDLIDKGDIDFFVTKDYNHDLRNVVNTSEVVDIINSIREPISLLDETNLDHTRKYLQVLSKLSEVYTNC